MPEQSIPAVEYRSWPSYILGLFLAIQWAVFIPYSRYLMGVHSLDQLVFGMMMGAWAGFTMHFLLRDHILNYYACVL